MGAAPRFEKENTKVGAFRFYIIRGEVPPLLHIIRFWKSWESIRLSLCWNEFALLCDWVAFFQSNMFFWNRCLDKFVYCRKLCFSVVGVVEIKIIRKCPIRVGLKIQNSVKNWNEIREKWKIKNLKKSHLRKFQFYLETMVSRKNEYRPTLKWTRKWSEFILTKMQKANFFSRYELDMNFGTFEFIYALACNLTSTSIINSISE